MSASTTSQELRLFVYRYFLEHAAPPVVEELMTKFELSRDEVVAMLRILVDRRDLALLRGTDRILMAWPLSAVATPFRVTVGEKRYFANCAWDAIAFHALLGEDVRIDSHCHHCGQQIVIEMSDGRAKRVEPEQTIVHLGARPTEWWEDIVAACSNKMVFFDSPAHRDASNLNGPADHAASLTPDQVHALGLPLYERRLQIDYTRPNRDELVAHFTSLGFTGPFWTE